MPYTCVNAVLLLSFNRLDTIKQTLAQIAKHKPPRIYLASDGARANKILKDKILGDIPESKMVSDIREYLLANINWDCKIHTRFLSENLGCKLGVSTAIEWFFTHEEQGIILEDDCLPSDSFFGFCDEMLERYKTSDNIFIISGWSALDFAPKAKATLKEDYFFSKYNHIWGWASWRRAWKHYQREFIDFESEFKALNNFISKKEKKYLYKILKTYSEGKIDTWDYPWSYSIWKQNGLCVYPKANMIQNIGFNRDDATHTTGDSKFATMKVYELDFPLKHPQEIIQNKHIDSINFKICFAPPNILVRIINKILRILKRCFKIVS